MRNLMLEIDQSNNVTAMVQGYVNKRTLYKFDDLDAAQVKIAELIQIHNESVIQGKQGGGTAITSPAFAIMAVEFDIDPEKFKKRLYVDPNESLASCIYEAAIECSKGFMNLSDDELDLLDELSWLVAEQVN